MTDATLLELSVLSVVALTVVAFWHAKLKPVKIKVENVRVPRR